MPPFQHHFVHLQYGGGGIEGLSPHAVPTFLETVVLNLGPITWEFGRNQHLRPHTSDFETVNLCFNLHFPHAIPVTWSLRSPAWQNCLIKSSQTNVAITSPTHRWSNWDSEGSNYRPRSGPHSCWLTRQDCPRSAGSNSRALSASWRWSSLGLVCLFNSHWGHGVCNLCRILFCIKQLLLRDCSSQTSSRSKKRSCGRHSIQKTKMTKSKIFTAKDLYKKAGERLQSMDFW